MPSLSQISGPTYAEVWRLPNVDYAPKDQYKEEADVIAACDASEDCPGYWVTTSDDLGPYIAFSKGSRTFGLGAPNENVAQVFAKNAGSDLVKLGVSKKLSSYTEGELATAEYFGVWMSDEKEAQARCNYVGAPCLGYFKGQKGYVLCRDGKRTFKKGSPSSVTSVMVKGEAAKPTKEEKKAARKAERVAKKGVKKGAKKAAESTKKSARDGVKADKKAARKAERAKQEAARKAARKTKDA